MLYARIHLPQGSPTSPALANLCAYRVDCRLSGLAKAVDAHYTRYADDLAFSGDKEFARSLKRFSAQVAAILSEEGFRVNHHKTRTMRQGVRQHLAGLVANQHINVVRADFDRLKAILTNCVRHGPASQNHDSHPYFRSHLEGRVGFVEMANPKREDVCARFSTGFNGKRRNVDTYRFLIDARHAIVSGNLTHSWALLGVPDADLNQRPKAAFQ